MSSSSIKFSLVSDTPYITKSIVSVGTGLFKNPENYAVYLHTGFHKLVSASKKYKFIDEFVNVSIVDRVSTVELILNNKMDKDIIKKTRKIITDFILILAPLLTRYATILHDIT
jgi:hypothetical protein